MSTSSIPSAVEDLVDEFEAELDARMGTVTVPTGPMPNDPAHQSVHDGELERIVADARREHFPDLTGAKWADSWQDRDTYVEHFD